jgi:hypothetical protein
MTKPNDLEGALIVRWTLMVMPLLADQADPDGVRAVLSQQMAIDYSDLRDPQRDAPLLARICQRRAPSRLEMEGL